MSKNAKNVTKNTGAKGATKNQGRKNGRGAAETNGGRGALGGRGARTIAIENFIARSKRPVTVRNIEDALTSVKCIRNHVATLYSKRLLSRHDENGRPNDHGAFYAIRKAPAKKTAPKTAPPAETGAESK